MVQQMLANLSVAQHVATERSQKRKDDFVRHVSTTIEQVVFPTEQVISPNNLGS